MSDTFHLFIDTNVLLSFHAFTNDDLEELRKIVALIEKQKLYVYLTRTVVDEFFRNREAKLAESLKSFDITVIRSIPRFVEVYPDAEKFRNILSDAEELRKKLLELARKDATDQKLAADKLINENINSVIILEPDGDTISRAKERLLLHNPPGKKDSFGDRLNWQTLLQAVPKGVDLYMLTRDGDYSSALDKTLFHQFLVNEWGAIKGSKVYLHSEIRKFMSSHFPGLKFATDLAKTECIARLIDSGNFANTHAAIANLLPLADALTNDEILQLAKAATENSQIFRIGEDEDVKSFYKYVLPKAAELYSPELEAELEARFHFKG